jgi:hypothetical protein
MDNKHAAEFELELTAAMEIYGAAAPSEATLRMWWAILRPYPIELVSAALSDHCRYNKFCPRPADIIERLESCDGRPSADEAWSLALQAQDEAATLVWSDEIAQSWGIARPILDIGDEVGARHAFVSAYERLCAEARRKLTRAKWVISIGTDKTARADVLTRAVEQGRLSVDQIRPLLPSQERTEMTAVAGLLTGNVSVLPDLQTREARRFLATIREVLIESERREAAERDARTQRRERERAFFEERRAAALAALENLETSKCMSNQDVTEQDVS